MEVEKTYWLDEEGRKVFFSIKCVITFQNLKLQRFFEKILYLDGDVENIDRYLSMIDNELTNECVRFSDSITKLSEYLSQHGYKLVH